MKNYFLLLLITVGLVTGCDKDDDDDVIQESDIATQILGTWITIDNSYEYFDQRRIKIYEEPLDQSDLGVLYTFDNKGNIRVQRGGLDENDNYTISSTDNKNYINFLRSDASLEIVSISDSEMVLSAVYLEDEYHEDGEAKIAPMAVYTVTFRKQ
jgi:hypothetical protein